MQQTFETNRTLHSHCGQSAVQWKSVFAGAVAAAVVSLILLSLGAGIGFVAFSPFGGDKETIAGFTVKMAIWMIVMQWLSAAIGGYIAGRLRNKAPETPKDEVFFRDTAHGFLTWAVATLIVVTLLASTMTAVVTGGVKAAAAVTIGAAAGAGKEMAKQPPSPAGGMHEGPGYYVDRMFRSDMADADGSMGASNKEASRILLKGVMQGDIPEEDRQYLAQKISVETGVSAEEGRTRVETAIAALNEEKQQAMDAAEKARKASGSFSIFTALSMLIGAFIAAVAAAMGGRERDED
jgi:hypothetical protein